MPFYLQKWRSWGVSYEYWYTLVGRWPNAWACHDWLLPQMGISGCAVHDKHPTIAQPDTSCRYSIDCLALPEIEFQGSRKSEEIGRYRRLDTLMIWPDNVWSSARLSRRWW